MSRRRALVVLLATLVAVAILGIIGLGVEPDLQATSLAIPGTPSSRGEALARADFGESVPFAVMLRGPAAAIDRQGPRLVGALRVDRATTTISPWEHAAPAALRPGPDRALVLVDFHRPLAAVIRDTVPALERTLAAHVHPPVMATQSGFAAASGRWKSTRRRARSGPGRRAAGAACSQGEMVVAARSRRSAATRRGPWRSIAAAGPRSMTAKGTDSPKSARASASPRDEEVPGIAREVGCRSRSTPRPMMPRTATATSVARRMPRARRRLIANAGRHRVSARAP